MTRKMMWVFPRWILVVALSSPITNGPLTALGGRWLEGNGIFPTTTSCSNFWTDVYFDQ